MSGQRSKRSKAAATLAPQWGIGGRQAVRITMLLCGIALAIVLTSIFWGKIFPVRQDRLITIYRTHGCTCVFSWAEKLKKQGFTVRLFEFETLEYVRAALHTPTEMNGCHLGKFMDYFVEGHVSAVSMDKLARTRPPGLGIAVADKLNARYEHMTQEVSREPTMFVAGVNRHRSDLEQETLEWPGTQWSSRVAHPDSHD